MSENYEVISAFLDDEPIDSRMLADALSEPAGRELLIDLIALRHLTQIKAEPASTDRGWWRFGLRVLAAAAAILVAVWGGYLVGERRRESTLSAAPAATRIVMPSSPWRDVPSGRMR